MKLRLLFLVSISILCSCQKHCLFNSGQSSYTIVIAPESSECVRYAAEELQYWLHEVSGVNLPIVEEGKQGNRLVINSNSSGEDDSFTYYSKGGDIFLCGDNDRGTLYSVYSFLEREFGCRWYNSRVSLTPKCDSWYFDKLYNREVPGLRMRNDFYYDVIHHPEFATRMRSNSCLSRTRSAKFGGSQNYLGCHTLPKFVTVDKYFDSHPEYFSEIDGKRIRENAQVCLSNPDVLKIVIEEVRKTMREQPDYLVYSVSQGDFQNPCQCEKCRAIKEQYGNEESGILVWFVNQVADAIKDEFPDKFIGTFAYFYSRHAPKNIKPRDNVVIRLCSIELCQAHKMEDCQYNTPFLDDLKDWSGIAKHLYIWDYTTDFINYALPLPNIPVLQNRIKHYRDSGAIGMMSQGSYPCPINAFEDLKAYIIAKLQWNPDADVDAIIKDFTDGFFGPDAGPIIREYLDFESRTLLLGDNHAGIYMNEDAPIYSSEFVKQGREYFRQARTAVVNAGGDNELINRLEYAEIGLCLLETLLTPEQGRADGSLDLIKRVAEREGITTLREFGEHTKTDEYIKFLETK